MNFTIMQFEMFCETLSKLSKETNPAKKKELIEKLELIRKGYLPVSFTPKK